MVATGSADHDARVWDVATGDKLHSFEGHESEPAVTFSPDGKILITASSDKTALWDVTTGKPLRVLEQLPVIHHLAFSPDSKTLAIESYYTVGVWDVATGKPMHSQSFGGEFVAFSADSKLLATRGGLWDIASGKELRSLQRHSSQFFSLALSPDGKTLATGSFDRAGR
jgi:WD40 repeat protein